ncbi:uncharacterized protein N7469_004740 [Penicillium citrinum]|uniref:Uncharacterized protein n=2 Tax=Penicillium TaxID=5073 RepID=A0A9W9P7P9_PENCI|nr:uncharacterized protein N7469_004740 [Penicillium citrinum]KAJ5235572.1 hypothetical protein N7469_004740 [Penicillium citrinum]
MKFNMSQMMVISMLMLLVTLVMGSDNVNAFEQLHRREGSAQTAEEPFSVTPVPLTVTVTITETDTVTDYIHTTVSFVNTCSIDSSACTPTEGSSDSPIILTQKTIETSTITVFSTEAECTSAGSTAKSSGIEATVIDTKCIESTTETMPPATVTECPGEKGGCASQAPGASQSSPSVTEEFVTKTLTMTTCPHSGSCTETLTTLVTPIAHPGTGTGLMPVPTGGIYVNTTEKAVTSKATNPSESTGSKSPSGPTSTATHPPKYNGALAQQTTMGQILALVGFIVILLEYT